MAQTKVQLLQPDLGDVIDFDSSTLFMDGADNRVGIRNTNPQYELDVTGTINATNFRGNISVGTIDDWITHTGDTNTKFGFPAADTFSVETSGSSRLYIKSDGKIGINTTTPNSALEVQGDGGVNDATITFTRLGSPSNGSVIGSNFYRIGTDSVAGMGAYRESAMDDAYLAFHTQPTGGNFTERLRITSGGAVQVNGGAVHLDANGELAVFETDTNLAFTNSAKLAFDYSGNVARIRSSHNGSGTTRNLGLYIGNAQKFLITSSEITAAVQLNLESAGSYIKSNQLKFNPSGHAYIDHGVNSQDIIFRVSNSSALDFTAMTIDSGAQQTHFGKQIVVGLQGGNDVTTIGGGSGIGAYIQLEHASSGINTKLMGNNDSYLNQFHGNLAIGEDDPDGNKLLIRAATTVGTTKGHIMLTGDGATNGEGPQIVFSESGSGSSFAGAYVGHIREGSNSTGSLVFGTRATGGDANTVPTERLRIYSTGQILYQASSGDNTFTSKRTNAAGSDGNYFFHMKAQDNNGNNVGEFGFHRDTAVDDSRFVVKTRNTGGSSQDRLQIDSKGRVTINPYNTFHSPTHQPTLTLSNESESNLYQAGKWSHAAIGINNTTHTANGGSKSQIVFGYLPRAGGYDFEFGAAYMGATSVSQSGAGKVDLVFGTKDVTSDTQPSEKLRITSANVIGVMNPNINDYTGWHSNSDAVIAFREKGNIISRNEHLLLSQNFRYDSSDVGKFQENGYGTLYTQACGSIGQHEFYITTTNNSSGQGAAASMTPKMKIGNTVDIGASYVKHSGSGQTCRTFAGSLTLADGQVGNIMYNGSGYTRGFFEIWIISYHGSIGRAHWTGEQSRYSGNDNYVNSNSMGYTTLDRYQDGVNNNGIRITRTGTYGNVTYNFFARAISANATSNWSSSYTKFTEGAF